MSYRQFQPHFWHKAAGRPPFGGICVLTCLLLIVGCSTAETPNPVAAEVPSTPPAATTPLASASPTPEPTVSELSKQKLRMFRWITHGDFDGDGRRDTAIVETRNGGLLGTKGNPGRIVITLASGRRVETGWRPTGYLTSLFGSYDIDENGSDELFVNAGGNTASSGYLMSLQKSRLRIIRVEHPNGQVEGFGYNFYAHSNAVPLGTADVACLDYWGQPSLLVSSSRLTTNSYVYKEMRRSPREWHLWVYVLDGLTLHRVTSSHGVAQPGEWAPPPAAHANSLQCGHPRTGAVDGPD